MVALLGGSLSRGDRPQLIRLLFRETSGGGASCLAHTEVQGQRVVEGVLRTKCARGSRDSTGNRVPARCYSLQSSM